MGRDALIVDEERLAALITAQYEALAERLAASPFDVWDERFAVRGLANKRGRRSCHDGSALQRKAFHGATSRLRVRLHGSLEPDRSDRRPASNDDSARQPSITNPACMASSRRGTPGALSHVVIHAIDSTGASRTAPTVTQAAANVVLDGLVAGGHAHFGIDTTDRRFESDDTNWSWGVGDVLQGRGTDLVAALSAHTATRTSHGHGAQPHSTGFSVE
jgi:hypothetical protein